MFTTAISRTDVTSHEVAEATDGVSTAAARAVNATKLYGTGPAAVRALGDVSVAFARGPGAL